jgi:hypothetical protein
VVRERAAAASPLWRASLLEGEAPPPEFAGRVPERYLLGVEMIREGYLVHHGRSRLFSQEDRDLALLTGDYLYAAGLVEICGTGDLAAVAALAELISNCSRRRGDQVAEDDDRHWAETVAALGR